MGGYTQFRTKDEPKADEVGKDIRSRQIDELIKIASDKRVDVYGPNFDEDVANFYNLFERTRRMPTFRPRISAPQLQLLLLSEAADLTDANIRIFIHTEDDRDKQREKAFQQHWRQEFFNLHMLMAQVYAQFSGTSFLQVGHDPFAKSGQGNVWLRARRTGTWCDPISPWMEDWSWQVLEDDIYLDKASQYFMHTESVKNKGGAPANLAGPPAGALEMPSGPMGSTVRGLPGGDSYTKDGPMKMRTMYGLDMTRRELTEKEEAYFIRKKWPVPDSVFKYPNGRRIIDLEGTIVSDGDSPIPLGDMWPAIPVWAVPPWDSVWCPPPMKYTRSLQDAAEAQMTNTYENARRLNNGMMIIHESTGLTANTVGGLPGEVVVVAANSAPGQGIEIKYPPPFPAQMIQLPQAYLALQKELRGHTQARQGNPGSGNIGADLFEAAVDQSQGGTKLSARLFSWSAQKVVELVYYMMCKSYTETRIFRDKGKAVKWEPKEGAEKYEVELPEGAVRALSASTLRKLVIELKKNNMIDTRSALEMLDIPDADTIADTLENELKLAALAKMGRK
jgi:hypothetical protein